MDLTDAIGKHAEWKVKLRSAISRRETLDAETIAKDHVCELGKWLHGDGKTKFGQLPSHAACVSKHAAFHVEAGKVATKINAGQFADAETMLGSESPYASASSAVATAITVLKKEARL